MLWNYVQALDLDKSNKPNYFPLLQTEVIRDFRLNPTNYTYLK